MKHFIINYILHIHNIYIQNDILSIVKDWAIPYTKFILFLHNIYVWLAAIIFFPIFIADMKIRKSINFNKLKNILN